MDFGIRMKIMFTMQDAVLLFSSWIFPIGLDLDGTKGCSSISGCNSGGVLFNHRGSRWQHLCSFGKHGSGVFEFWFLAHWPVFSLPSLDLSCNWCVLSIVGLFKCLVNHCLRDTFVNIVCSLFYWTKWAQFITLISWLSEQILWLYFRFKHPSA